MTKYIEDGSNFGADGSFFHLIREGLKGFVDGEDYFDLLAYDVVFEYVISVPGYPTRVEGRQNVIDLYSDYDSYMAVQSADNLRVSRDPAESVVVLNVRCTANPSKLVVRTTTTSSPSLRLETGK